MDKNEFQECFRKLSVETKTEITDEEIESFFKYMNLLLEWNQKMNLTAITEPKEVILKHFLDSLTIKDYLRGGSKVIDIGTGAGFPGIPLAICNKNVEFLLADSLQKRISFLQEVKEQLNLKNVQIKHTRAEDLGRDKSYREKFDYCVSRAVAPLRVLTEYTIPFVKKNGYSICMKGNNGKEELEAAKNAIKILGGKVEKVEEFKMGEEELGRTIIVIKKERNTDSKYPRKAGTPTKMPL